MKLEIENFQSLEGKNILEFKPGITMIVGASNSGKTAIMRSLRGLILNYRGNVNKYKTHFQDHLEVSLTLEEGSPKYTWYKDDKSTRYSITDEEGQEEVFEKAGNDNIYSFDSNFPFVLRDKRLINTHTEKDGLPFPFDLNDVELFKIFEELYNISSTSTIFKFMKKQETQTNSNISNNQLAIANNKQRIETIIEVEEKYDIDKLEALKDRADKIQAGMIGIDDDIKIARDNNKISKSIKAVLDKKLDSELLREKEEHIESLLKESKDLQKDISIICSNDKIDSIKVYKKEFDTALIEPYRALCSDLKLANSLEREQKELQEEFESLQEEQKELQEELAKIDVCPLCGNQINKEK